MRSTLVVVVLTALQAACSASSDLASDPYEGCVDVGYLAIWADSGAAAEDRMTVRARELGGDTLVLGSAGASRSGDGLPKAIADRLAELTAPARDRRAPVSAASPVQTLAGEGSHLYYGAALRCGLLLPRAHEGLQRASPAASASRHAASFPLPDARSRVLGVMNASARR